MSELVDLKRLFLDKREFNRRKRARHGVADEWMSAEILILPVCNIQVQEHDTLRGSDPVTPNLPAIRWTYEDPLQQAYNQAVVSKDWWEPPIFDPHDHIS
jgi:hypothetical protein